MPDNRPVHDPVDSPAHYQQGGFEVLDVIEAYDLPYHLGNVIKYVLRHQYKGNPEQDLRKAQYYLNRYLTEFFDTEQIAEKDELYQSFPSTRYEVQLPKERIAGSTDEAQAIKDVYYTHDPFLIEGYCTSCDKELTLGEPYLKAYNPSLRTDLKFCSYMCKLAWEAHGQ